MKKRPILKVTQLRFHKYIPCEKAEAASLGKR